MGTTIEWRAVRLDNRSSGRPHWCWTCTTDDVQTKWSLDETTCGKPHQTREDAERHCELRRRAGENAAGYRLPAMRSLEAAKSFVIGSGPAWAPLTRGNHHLIAGLARKGIIEIRGTQFRIYHLTTYGLWCRDRWIRLRFDNCPVDRET
jgi:hypothetical protein